MGIKNLKLSVPSSKKPTDPLDVFNKLTLRGSIENIWERKPKVSRNGIGYGPVRTQ